MEPTEHTGNGDPAKGVRGAQGVQGLQGIVGPPGEGAEGSGAEGSQGVQGIQGIQGIQGDEGKRGFSARADDIPRWVLGMLKVLVPAYVILALAVIAGFFIGFRYIDHEVERTCDVVVAIGRGSAQDLIDSANAASEGVEMTPEQKARREASIQDYLDRTERRMAGCTTATGG